MDDYCNLRSVVTSSCVEGNCTLLSTECEVNEICLSDSNGTRCESTQLTGPLPWMSCNANTAALSFTGLNHFTITAFQCSDDCPQGYTCNAQTCLCEEDQGPPQPPAQCPDPVFTNKYFDPPAITHTFDQLADMYLDFSDSIRELDEGIMALPTINIEAYEHMRGEAVYYLPFPNEQLLVQPSEGPSVWAPEDNPFLELGGCANDYFVGDKALDIYSVWLEYPQGEYDYCMWGGADVFMGVLTVCPDMVADWFDEVVKEGTVDVLGIIPK